MSSFLFSKKGEQQNMAEKRKDSKGRILRTGEYQRANGLYQYRYKDVNGKMKAVCSIDLTELREKEKQIQKDIADGIISDNNLTLNDMFEKHMSGKRELKASTRENYLYMYNKYVFDTLGKRKIADIKYSDVRAFFNNLIDEKGFKPNSVEILYTIIHPVFTLAVRDDLIRKNPSDNLMREIKQSHDWSKPKRKALTTEQQRAFIDYTKNSPIYGHWLPLFTTFLGTGCRVGEVIGLTWNDVDFDNNTISINHNLVYRKNSKGICEFHVTTPKTESGKRIIPMLPEVRRAIMQERKKQMQNGFSDTEIDGYKGFIFVNRENYIHNPQTINRAIQRIYKAYNEEEIALAKEENREPVIIPHFSCHHLRHTFCTRYCEIETNLKVIQTVMGHADISTTMDVYAECTNEKKQESFDNLVGKMKIS